MVSMVLINMHAFPALEDFLSQHAWVIRHIKFQIITSIIKNTFDNLRVYQV